MILVRYIMQRHSTSPPSATTKIRSKNKMIVYDRIIQWQN